MSIMDGTKWLFAATLQKMLLTKSLSQIKITDLTSACGAQRQTFYYHFKDKYDLVAWIYEQDFQKALEDASFCFGPQHLENLLLLMQANRSFYKKVFDDHSQNALASYIRQINLSYTRRAYLQTAQTETIPSDVEFTMNFLSYAWGGCLCEWALGQCDYSARQLAQLMYRNIQQLNIPETVAAKEIAI